MTAPPDYTAAADLLLSNWSATTRIAELPGTMRPKTRAEGYEAAAAVAERSGSAVAGWKIAATSEAGQKHINVDGPIIGRILKSRLLPPGAGVPLGDNIMRVAEAEFAFGFTKDLPARDEPYSRGRGAGCRGLASSLDRSAGQPLPGFHQGGCRTAHRRYGLRLMAGAGARGRGALAPPRSLRACGEGLRATASRWRKERARPCSAARSRRSPGSSTKPRAFAAASRPGSS